MPEEHTRLLADRYELTAPLGRGTMGTVWRAWDRSLGREVAVKQIRRDPGLTPEQQAELRERMIREARFAARFNHPCVATVHDAIVVDGLPWIIMELVEGRSLEQVIDEEGPLPPRLVAQIGVDLLSALRAAHAQGILHRDVKPSNVLLTDTGRVVLTDFGIAKAVGDTDLTRTGMVIGSPGYTAPERARGEYAGPESDLWSLGATLYFAVEGRPAYERGSVAATLAALMTETADPPTQAGPLRPIIEGLLQKDHTMRLSAEQADAMLRAVADGRAPDLSATARPVHHGDTADAHRPPQRVRGPFETGPKLVGAAAMGGAGFDRPPGGRDDRGGPTPYLSTSEPDGNQTVYMARPKSSGLYTAPPGSAPPYGPPASPAGGNDRGQGPGPAPGAQQWPDWPDRDRPAQGDPGQGHPGPGRADQGAQPGRPAPASAFGPEPHRPATGAPPERPGQGGPGGQGRPTPDEQATMLNLESPFGASGPQTRQDSRDGGGYAAPYGAEPQGAGRTGRYEAGPYPQGGERQGPGPYGGGQDGGRYGAGQEDAAAPYPGSAQQAGADGRSAPVPDFDPPGLGTEIFELSALGGDENQKRSAKVESRTGMLTLIGVALAGLAVIVIIVWSALSGSGDDDDKRPSSSARFSQVKEYPEDRVPEPPKDAADEAETESGAGGLTTTSGKAAKVDTSPPPAAGLRRHADPSGFTIDVPEKMITSGSGRTVQFGDGGRVLTVTVLARPRPAVLDAALDAERRSVDAGEYPDYRMLRLNVVDPAPYPGTEVADWEFTYTRGGRTTHVLARWVTVSGGATYVLRWTAPDESWQQDAAQREAVLGSFVPGGGSAGS